MAPQRPLTPQFRWTPRYHDRGTPTTQNANPAAIACRTGLIECGWAGGWGDALVGGATGDQSRDETRHSGNMRKRSGLSKPFRLKFLFSNYFAGFSFSNFLFPHLRELVAHALQDAGAHVLHHVDKLWQQQAFRRSREEGREIRRTTQHGLGGVSGIGKGNKGVGLESKGRQWRGGAAERRSRRGQASQRWFDVLEGAFRSRRTQRRQWGAVTRVRAERRETYN